MIPLILLQRENDKLECPACLAHLSMGSPVNRLQDDAR
jgi:hypothetical protein